MVESDSSPIDILQATLVSALAWPITLLQASDYIDGKKHLCKCGACWGVVEVEMRY